MKNEKLYIYFDSAQLEQDESLKKNILSLDMETEFINVDENQNDLELVNGLIEKSENSLPILRIGEHKIRAVLYNPNIELLQKIFSDSSANIDLPQPTIYSTTWCGDCRQLKFWMDSQKITYDEILIEDSEELKEQIVRWSGGRRVIPTVDYESIGRLFNPGITLFQKLYKTT